MRQDETETRLSSRVHDNKDSVNDRWTQGNVGWWSWLSLTK
jgi:hypothetical protein